MRYTVVVKVGATVKARSLALGGGAMPDGRLVFAAVGGREMRIMRRSLDEMIAALEVHDGLEMRQEVYAGADHLTVLPRALIDGILYLYGRSAGDH